MMHADATTVGVRFRVQKGSSFDFECSSNAAWQAQSSEIRKLFHRIEEIEALQYVSINVCGAVVQVESS